MTTPEVATSPTCYRHPDRETWVRCTRCERPICPDCMKDAAVGFQCPECVAQGNKTVREARTTFGGRVSGNDRAVTMVLLGLNIAIFVLQLATDGELTDRYKSFGYAIALGDEYYRLLTAAFLHAGVLHIAFNMYCLFLVGPPLEATLGRVRYLTLYLLAAVGGSAASYVFSSPGVSGVGASGAIFGLFGAYLVVARRLNADARSIATVVGINLVLGFVIPNIDWRAHLGGLVVGAVVGAAFAYAPPGPRRALLGYGASALVGLGLVAVVLLRTAALTS